MQSWNFCPNLGASIFYAALFALTTCLHIFQAFYYRKGYSWVIIMANVWQTGAYVSRSISIETPDNIGLYSTWFVLLLCAPLWTNAYVYMVLGRMVWNFKKGARLHRVKAWHLGKIFVCVDFIALLIQIGGATIAVTSGNQSTDTTVYLGLHIYMVGIGIQLLLIIIFTLFSYSLFRSLRTELDAEARRLPLLLLYTLWGVLLLIAIRIIFRLTEYSKGLNSTIPNHEAYQYVLDSTPMLLAAYIFNVIHPGRIMPGAESDIPGCYTRRQRRKQGIPLERNHSV
ncbi:hypothetical protein ANO11243_084620 [Dothideomycetidae sp. 11243]|nr:hypothetical protein ANO11243_084620 [fungal sp. No.11243]